MGVFSKLKGIFYDEVEVEEDDTKEIEKVNKIVKKEPKVENEMPKIEELKFKPIEVEEPKEEVKKQDNTFDERELFRSERTFNFVDFDNDEEEIVPSKRNVLSEQNRAPKIENPISPEVEQSKVFKPTPVISPIWGVLNKDYKKDEIQEKTNKSVSTTSASVTSYDSVRKKAYGTLEDQLEDTLNTVNKLTTKEVKEEAKKREIDVDILEQKTQKIENLISKIEEATNDLDKTMSIGELEDKAEIENFEEPTTDVVSDKTLTDSTLEHDLFNLIDSMYDDKEE